MVFQSYALYPHMTVRDNMAFGLKLRGRRQGRDRRRRCSDAADDPEPRRPARAPPGQLSGGQRQRVAIGRAIVREPAALPVRRAALQPRRRAARADARRDRASCTSELGTTMIYVTHDQVEAMTLADRIVVLNAGRDRAGRLAARALRPPGEPLRRAVHRHAADEHAEGIRSPLAPARGCCCSSPSLRVTSRPGAQRASNR